MNYYLCPDFFSNFTLNLTILFTYPIVYNIRQKNSYFNFYLSQLSLKRTNDIEIHMVSCFIIFHKKTPIAEPNVSIA